ILSGSNTTIPFRHDDPAAIGIEQDLPVIKTHALPWIKRTMGTETIDLSWLNAGKVYMPVMIGAVRLGVESDDVRWLGIIKLIEQQQLYLGGITRVHAEVHAAGCDGRAERRTAAPRLHG